MRSQAVSTACWLLIMLMHCHITFPNCSDHWRKNTPVLGQKFQAYAIDLLGYGFSDKPDPRGAPPNSIYNFETWGQQLLDFTQEVIGAPAHISCNSVGGAQCQGGDWPSLSKERLMHSLAGCLCAGFAACASSVRR